VLALAGCGDSSGESPEGGGPIRFQLFGDPEELRNYRELIEAYRSDGGGRVELVEAPDRKAHLARLTTSFAGGAPPDVFLVNHRNLGGFAGRAIVPASDADTDGFYPVPLQAFTVGGELQCVPQNVSNLVVYYNRDRFREAGVPEPKRGWTYDEFLAAARRLGRGSVGIEPSTIRTAPFVWGSGGELVDDQDEPTRFTLDTPQARRGLGRLLALRREGLTPTAEETEARDIETRFLDGDLAMLFGSRRETPSLRTIKDFDWDVGPFPRMERPVSVLHSDGFCVAKGGDVEAARRFVAFATGRRGQEILARGGRTVPSLRSVAESPAFLDRRADPRSSQVFLDQVAVLRRLPTTRNWTEIEDRVDKALESAFFGRITLDELIERIEDETSGAF
jgi:multiple sugar transport system substrate-binding protein